METIIGILGLTLMIICIFLFSKYKKLKKENKNLTKKMHENAKIFNDLKKPIRYGYIDQSHTLKMTRGTIEKTYNFNSLIYVKEIDRYTNGTSKIEIEKIEPGIDRNKISNIEVEHYIRDEFKSIVKTSDVTWLESEEAIKKIRKDKLDQLKKSLNND